MVLATGLVDAQAQTAKAAESCDGVAVMIDNKSDKSPQVPTAGGLEWPKGECGSGGLRSGAHIGIPRILRFAFRNSGDA